MAIVWSIIRFINICKALLKEFIEKENVWKTEVVKPLTEVAIKDVSHSKQK